MKRPGHMVTVVLLSMMATGCGVMYYPQLADVPLIDHQGDTRVSAAAYCYPHLGFEATTTVGLANHFAWQVHLNYSGNTYFHASPGVFFRNDNRVLEAYVGLGMGSGGRSAPAHYLVDYGRGRYTSAFLQLNYGWKNLGKAHIDYGFSIKVGRFDPVFNGKIPYIDETNNVAGRDIAYYRTNLQFEPQAFFRIGGEHVKYSLQMGFVFLPDLSAFNRANNDVFYYSPFSITNGITFSF